MLTETKSLDEQLQATLKTARDLAAKAEEEDRDFTADEREQIKRLMDEAKALKVQQDDRRDGQELRKQIQTLTEGVEPAEPTDPATVGKSMLQTPWQQPVRKSLGDHFTSSPEWNGWLKQFPSGRIPEGAKGITSPPVAFGGMKTLITGLSDTSGGALITAQDLGLRDTGTFQRPLTIRDIITVGQTMTDTVEFVRVTGFTNAAAPVAEATATGGGSGTKPESAMTLERVSETVKTIAHWIPATKRVLSDAAQIRTLIDNFLRYGLEEEVEDQIVTGSGDGENFTGIENTSGVQEQAFDTNTLVTARKARTKVRTVGRAVPNAYVFHPVDWEEIQLTTDGENRFYFGGPVESGVPRLWGLPVVESEALTEGTGYVGDFRQCVLWDREQASIQVSDSHSNFFIRNMVAILAELRAAFGIIRPSALVSINLSAGS